VVNGAKPGEWLLVREGSAIESVVDGVGLQPRADPPAENP